MMRELMFSSYFCNLANSYSGILLTITLGIVASAKELGYFSVAYMLIGFGLLAPSILGYYALPHLAKEKNKTEHVRKKRNILMLVFSGMTVMALPLLLLPEFIIHTVFGAAFMPASQCLPIMAVGMVAAGIIMVTQSIIASQHRERLLVVSSGSLALAISLLTFFLRDHLTAVNAAYIYTASYVFGMIVSLAIITYTHFARDTAGA